MASCSNQVIDFWLRPRLVKQIRGHIQLKRGICKPPLVLNSRVALFHSLLMLSHLHRDEKHVRCLADGHLMGARIGSVAATHGSIIKKLC